MDELGGTGCTPLHCAAHQGQAEALKVLLHAGGPGVCSIAPKAHLLIHTKATQVDAQQLYKDRPKLTHLVTVPVKHGIPREKLKNFRPRFSNSPLPFCSRVPSFFVVTC